MLSVNSTEVSNVPDFGSRAGKELCTVKEDLECIVSYWRLMWPSVRGVQGRDAGQLLTQQSTTWIRVQFRISSLIRKWKFELLWVFPTPVERVLLANSLNVNSPSSFHEGTMVSCTDLCFCTYSTQSALCILSSEAGEGRRCAQGLLVSEWWSWNEILFPGLWVPCSWRYQPFHLWSFLRSAKNSWAKKAF